jgi:DNA-binding NarL/FixJ family response regulator
MNGAKKTVFLVDDHPVVLAGIAGQLESAPDFHVCAAVRTLAEALGELPRATPQVALLDFWLGDCCGLQLLPALHALNAGTPVLVYSASSAAQDVARAVRAGVAGYMVKAEFDELVPALRAVVAGKNYYSPSVAGIVASLTHGTGALADGAHRCSPQEAMVVHYLGEGKSPKEIAGLLEVHEQTVYRYCDRACKKLGLRDLRELIVYAALAACHKLYDMTGFAAAPYSARRESARLHSRRSDESVAGHRSPAARGG